MEFILKNEIQKALFCVEEKALPGVKRIVAKVMKDASLVTDVDFECVNSLEQCEENSVVVIATLDHSEILVDLEKRGIVDFSDIRGKREVYLFRVLELSGKKTLLIAGSDKRGTIYGAFHLSELMEVSPWVYFADVLPKKQNEVVFTETVNMISKEPSVKYRGIFINDEWPSFGNWTCEKFGGFTAKMYEHVFELILRLKGNYLWPAMWSSNFSLEGPRMLSAELADEMGIVMSNSHHEPLLRHSEEWDMVKGEDTPYGTEWNFDKNKEGLKEYWKGGLLRNGRLENIITMGMRGERDSEILGHEAGLKENIQYLKDVLVTQNQLIKENVCEDLDQVPRMIALYKEVEAYYYGDENTPGLKGYEELDGVTLMLCEDNFGNMRYLPTAEEKNHRGGYGMYYHFDYHGGPISYEWVNSTSLAKVWEQMTMAYESGVSEIWIVNTGDLKPQELPISYFLDLAYDFDKWGSQAINSTEAYIEKWAKMQFSGFFTEEECKKITLLLSEYSRINSIYKPEALKPESVHPLKDYLADDLLKTSKELIDTANELLKTITLKVTANGTDVNDDPSYAAFYQLVYFPTVASMNVLQWNLYASKNHYYASLGAVIANCFAEKMTQCNDLDEMLKENYHKISSGKWNHMMSSEHVGFKNWNDEDARLPLRYLVDSKKKPRMIVSAMDAEGYSIGTDWTDRHLHLYHFMDPKCEEINLSIDNGCKEAFSYEASCEDSWVNISEKSGVVFEQKILKIALDDRKQIPSADGVATSVIEVKSAFARVYVHIYVLTDEGLLSKKNLVPCVMKTTGKEVTPDYLKLVLEADQYSEIVNGNQAEYKVLKPFGKFESGLKVFGDFCEFHIDKDMHVSYDFELPEEMDCQILLHLAPSNPIHKKEAQRFGFSINQQAVQIVQSVSDSFNGGDTGCMEWCRGVIVNEHEVRLHIHGQIGANRLSIVPIDPGVVLLRIEIQKQQNQD